MSVARKVAEILYAGYKYVLAEAIENKDTHNRNSRAPDRAAQALPPNKSVHHIVTTGDDNQAKYNLSRQKASIAMLFKEE